MSPHHTSFIGVDLAWQSERNTSGAAVLTGSRSGARLATVSDPLTSIDEVVNFVRAHVNEKTVTAIDAPLIMPNRTGMRPCERLVTKRYGGRHAGCHPSNRSLYPDAGSVRLAEALVADGHVHAPGLTAKDLAGSQPVIAEVYPHAAMVALFDLPYTIKYKPKWGIAQQRVGLAILRDYIGDLAFAEPPLLESESLRELLGIDLESLRGRALKQYEDTLDSLICAYIAFYFWYWGEEKTEFFGDLDTGYILNPILTEGGVPTIESGHGAGPGQRGSPMEIVRRALGHPLREEAGPDGTILLIAGVPGDVVAVVSESKVSILEFSQEWQGPYTLVENHIPVGDVHLSGLSGVDLKRLVTELVAVTRERRRGSFGKCEYCKKSVPPEFMHGDGVCQGCAERHF